MNGNDFIRRLPGIPSRCSACGEAAVVVTDREYLCGGCFLDRSKKLYPPQPVYTAPALTNRAFRRSRRRTHLMAAVVPQERAGRTA